MTAVGGLLGPYPMPQISKKPVDDDALPITEFQEYKPSCLPCDSIGVRVCKLRSL
jgi:hypothetical protein